MDTGALYLILGILLDSISILMERLKISDYITIPLGVISIVLIVVGAIKMRKFDNAIEQGRKIRMEKKKEKK